MQHGPISGRLIMPRRGKDWPQRGCRGSMTETMGSEHMSSGRGVIGWAGFAVHCLRNKQLDLRVGEAVERQIC